MINSYILIKRITSPSVYIAENSSNNLYWLDSILIRIPFLKKWHTTKKEIKKENNSDS